MHDIRKFDYSTDSGPQADVMLIPMGDEPGPWIEKTEEGICVSRNALVDDGGKAQDELDPEVEKALRTRLAELFEPLQLVFPEVMMSDENLRNEDDQEFEFRMFSGGVHRIVLREDEGMGDGAFVKLRDPRTFVVPRAVGQRKAEFENSAMTGEEVLERSGRRAWGLEVPWRVKILKVTESRTSQTTHIMVKVEPQYTAGKKTKPNKKRRILLRDRTKKAEEKARLTKLEEQNREEAEREKKSRKNREKKLKKRAKEKASKANGTVATSTEQVSD